jgi:hypothetical protein
MQRSSLRERNLELERRAAELELRGAEAAEREARRLREEVARLEGELGAEREKGLAGMSQEQLARMRHINSFLEHNLRENGEMLASLGQLQAEKEMKVQNRPNRASLGGRGCWRGAVHAVVAISRRK